MTTAHNILHITKTGAFETLRLFGAPDRDSAAMFIRGKFESRDIRSVVAIDADAPRIWGEMDCGEWAA